MFKNQILYLSAQNLRQLEITSMLISSITKKHKTQKLSRLIIHIQWIVYLRKSSLITKETWSSFWRCQGTNRKYATPPHQRDLASERRNGRSYRFRKCFTISRDQLLPNSEDMLSKKQVFSGKKSTNTLSIGAKTLIWCTVSSLTLRAFETRARRYSKLRKSDAD